MKNFFFIFALLFSFNALASAGFPKTILFVKDGLGSTEALTLDELDRSQLKSISCDATARSYRYEGPLLNLKSSSETRFTQTTVREMKIVFEMPNTTCDLSTSIAQYSIFMQSPTVPMYRIELTIVPRYNAAILHTPNGDYTGHVVETW